MSSYYYPDLYTVNINCDLLREHEEYDGDFEIIGEILGPDASEDDCRQLLFKVMEKARSTPRHPGSTDFYDWFFDTHWYEQLWDAVNSAVDDYIALTAREIVNEEKEN